MGEPNEITTTPDAQAGRTTTFPSAATVDMDQLTAQAATKASEAAEKKMEAVFKSMLQQNGLDAESINKMTAEWKDKQITPELAVKQRDDTISRLNGQLTSAERKLAAVTKGVPVASQDPEVSERVNACLALAESYVADDVTYDAALEKAMKIIPFMAESKQPPAPMAPINPAPSGLGGGELPKNPADKISQKTEQFFNGG